MKLANKTEEAGDQRTS